MKAEIEELRKQIQFHDYQYYVLNDPVITDQKYDKLYKKLVSLEQQHPELITPDSPTQRIGAGPLEAFNTVKHGIKMLSLDNTYNTDEVKDFFVRVERVLKTQPPYEVTLKVDGVAVSLLYEQGRFVRGATRGDGVQGDDITQNLRTIRSIPLRINSKTHDIKDFEVRGEVFLSKEAFNQLNQNRENQGRSLFANPRNAAAGTLKLLDPHEVAQRGLDIFIHTVPEQPVPRFNSHYAALQNLAEAGFKIIPHSVLCKDQKAVFKQIERWKHDRADLYYAVDGLVIKVDMFEYWEKLGATIKSPRWAIAYKYPSLQTITTVKDIQVQVGRTGRITPVAHLEPVQLSGSTISRATLHNEDEIRRKDIRIGDQVIIEKGGEVIPKVVSVVTAQRTGREKKYRFPKKCPVCNQSIVRLPDEVDWRCINTNCPAQIKGKILHFASRQAMDIEGLGQALVDTLVDKGIVCTIDDLYGLKKELLVVLDRMGKKSASNVLLSIKKSKQREFYRVLYALGIPNVGINASHILATTFQSIDAIQNARIDQLSDISGIGEVIATSIADYFHNPLNARMIKKLKTHGLQFKQSAVKRGDSSCKCKTFVFTGEFKELTRNQAQEKVRLGGGHPASSVSSKTDYVVVGKNPGSKYVKAKKLGITIISEDEFLKLISGG